MVMISKDENARKVCGENQSEDEGKEREESETVVVSAKEGHVPDYFLRRKDISL